MNGEKLCILDKRSFSLDECLFYAYSLGVIVDDE